MIPNATGLHAIYRPDNGEPVADIIFVHGLGGSGHETWRHGRAGEDDHFFWPDELAKELSDCAVWVFGYDGGISRLGSPGMIIGQRAGNMAVQLENNGLGIRPVVFVTHSMGGLIVKALVCDRPAGEHSDLIGNVRGIVFCGTPHLGSAFASAAVTLGSYLKVAGIQKHVAEMRRDEVALNQMHDRFLAWQRAHPIAIQTYAESRSLYRKRFFGGLIDLGQVVTRTSANTGLGDSPVDVDADHLELVKPHPGNKPLYDTVFLGVNSFIRRVLAPIGKPVVPSLSDLSDSAIQALFELISEEVGMRNLR